MGVAGQTCVLLAMLMLVPMLRAPAEGACVLQCFCHHPQLLQDSSIVTGQAKTDVTNYCRSTSGLTISLHRNTTCVDAMGNGTLNFTLGKLARRIVQMGIRKFPLDESTTGLNFCRALVTNSGPISVRQVRVLLCESLTDNDAALSYNWVNKTEWNEQILKNDSPWKHFIESVLDTNSRISEAIIRNVLCYYHNKVEFDEAKSSGATALQPSFERLQQYMARLVHHRGELLSRGINNTMQNFAPLALEEIGKTLPKELLHIWMKKIGTLADWFQMRLNSVVEDIVAINDEMDRVDVTEPTPKRYVFPLVRLRERLLTYHRRPLALEDAFGKQCGKQIAEGAELLRLMETLHMYIIIYWFQLIPYNQELSMARDVNTEVENWLLDTLTYATVSVDTSCVQLMVDMIERPTCPTEDPPQGVADRHRECRVRLASNVKHRTAHVPVTSYLAYLQRVDIDICLLSWIVSNEKSVCHQVHTGMVKSVNDMYCFLFNLRGEPCAQVTDEDVICSVSRSILWLMCPSFHRDSINASPFSRRDDVMVYSFDKGQPRCEPFWQPPILTGIHKRRLNVANLVYKKFRIALLQPLEVTLISANVVFRSVTAVVYGSVPKLRNVPGMLLLSFQFTGLVQIALSEVAYRFANAFDLSTAVNIDSALTVLSCLWLNTFCYEMYKCVRHLNLPDNLNRRQMLREFRKYSACVLIVWTAVSSAMIALERVDEAYTFHSRVIFLATVCLSILANCVLLIQVWDLYLRTRSDMNKMKITSSLKLESKKRIAFLIAKMCIFSGMGVFVRVAFHQVGGLPQAVYYVHLVSMLQGPAFFVLLVCNDSTIPLLRDSLREWWKPGVDGPPEGQGSAAYANWQRRQQQKEEAVATTAV